MIEKYLFLVSKQKEMMNVSNRYTPPSPPRDPLTREVEVLIIGGGFAGLLVSARLTEAGFTDQVLMEKGGDFGGTLC